MKRILLTIVIVSLTAASTWAYREYSPAPKQEYMLAQVELGKLRRIVNATGTVHTILNIDVGSQVSGRIAEVYVDFNDSVHQNQAIARIDQHSFQANLNGAKAALAVAKARVKINESGIDGAQAAVVSSNEKQSVYQARIARARASTNEAKLAFSRNKSLSSSGALSSGELDKIKAELAKTKADLNAAIGESRVHQQQIVIAQANLKKAQGELLATQSQIPQYEASLALAEIELERTIIRSPIEGIVINRAIDPGQTVAASLSAPNLFNIAQDLQTMVVHTMVDEADIGQIRTGQAASFSVDAYPDRQFSGEIIQIRKSPVSNRSVVRYVILISTNNPDLSLLPGMTALVRITVFESDEVSKIPSKALRFRPDSKTERSGHTASTVVWVLNKEKIPIAVSVQTGVRDDSHTELVTETLKPGDLVIVGQKLLK